MCCWLLFYVDCINFIDYDMSSLHVVGDSNLETFTADYSCCALLSKYLLSITDANDSFMNYNNETDDGNGDFSADVFP